jgi:uncharacterized 2Fe-2S/4Fe-4S cluster protein (DUF4445 family)
MEQIKITFQPGGKSTYVLKGTSILEAAGRLGIIFEVSCGNGTCGKCRVRLTEGATAPTPEEKILLSPAELNEGVRLACQSKINSPCEINIPENSRKSIQSILVSSVPGRKEINPSIRKIYVELSDSVIRKSTSDLEMLKKAVNFEFTADIYIIRQLSRIIRESKYKFTCVFSENELISLEKDDTTRINYGVAFDIGTTTLVGTLLNAGTGEELSVCARMNPQIIYGDDVIARINIVLNEPEGLNNLHHYLVKEMNEMINELATRAEISRKSIYKVTVAGNSVMEHILAGISPENLSALPFSLTLREGIEIKAQRIGININSDGSVYLLPAIGGFVGGDSVAAILYTQLHKSRETKLIIDIGTNGEVMLGDKSCIIAASTAAGPAFEGARISQGMRASRGAIEKVVIADDVEYSVVGNVTPIGICGTGLIDAVAEMLRKGIINGTGKIRSKKELADTLPEQLLKRIVEYESHNDFLLVDRPPIYITQQDIRELQLAKAAIAAGIKVLLNELAITKDDIKEVLLAGAFGNFIRRSNAKLLGIVPDLPNERIKFIGNTASMGAELVLLSKDMRKEAEDISRNTQHIQLSTKPEFNQLFADEMLFNDSE